MKKPIKPGAAAMPLVLQLLSLRPISCRPITIMGTL